MNIKEIVAQIESTMKAEGEGYLKVLEMRNAKCSHVIRRLRNTFCDDCDSFSVYMMLHDELWNVICDGNLELFLCPKCMEKRLGRKIVLDDLKICNVNYPYFFTAQLFENK